MRRILIAKGGALGDWLLTLPACSALRQALAPSSVVLLGRTSWVKLALRAGFVAAYSLEKPGWESLWVKGGELPEKIRSLLRNFDLILSFLSDPDGTWAGEIRRWTPARYLQLLPPRPGRPVALDYWLQLREFLQLELPLPKGPFICPWKEDLDAFEAWRSELEESQQRRSSQFPWVVLHAGSGSRKKNWPVDYWNWVLERLHDRDLWVVLLAGEAERDWIGSLAKKAHTIGLELPLATLVALLSQASLYVGNDSGITHLAAACGCPVLALFGPTDPGVWQPWGPRVTILKGGPTWEGLSPEKVLAHIENLLG
ncbi:glycosyltransferase family 9 protein [Candidatus Methylacidithermus pantelleriae]|uniref:Uncharacterized protein n=1 Tax=Candidatus Methylacidithermus pantelleriae TaxID=2744239 RepID=A0A8J2BJU6_9BACT|nr:glycosyltransferase family 9 protein [Candidatus Methylacidithermus pantelleriae]CAF0693964.1 conserved hypothetical protein [Candidatus Methylacidithermus pantelleriae]